MNPLLRLPGYALLSGRIAATPPVCLRSTTAKMSWKAGRGKENKMQRVAYCVRSLKATLCNSVSSKLLLRRRRRFFPYLYFVPHLSFDTIMYVITVMHKKKTMDN